MKNPTKTPWGFSQNPPPPGFFKLNSPPPWGMGVGTPWGPRGVWGWDPNSNFKSYINISQNNFQLGFGMGVGTPWGPRGVPTPIPHGGGELSFKNPGGGGFCLKPHGVLVGFFMHFYAFHTRKKKIFFVRF